MSQQQATLSQPFVTVTNQTQTFIAQPSAVIPNIATVSNATTGNTTYSVLSTSYPANLQQKLLGYPMLTSGQPNLVGGTIQSSRHILPQQPLSQTAAMNPATSGNAPHMASVVSNLYDPSSTAGPSSVNSSSSNTGSSYAVSQQSSQLHQQQSNQNLTSLSSLTNSQSQSIQMLNRTNLEELVKQVDPCEQLDDDVQDILLQIADDFVDRLLEQACKLAKHRKSATLDVKDVQLALERQWNMWIPGFGTDEIRPYKKAPATEAHKQRMALLKKNLKKL